MAMASRAAQHLQHWRLHRGALEELLTRLPDTAAAFRPWDGAMTTTALVAHIARSTQRLLQGVEAGGMTPPAGTPPPPATMADARTLLAAATRETAALLERLTDAQLDRVIAFRPGIEQPGAVLMAMSLDHEIHHKGQLWVYARMCGVEPPLYIARNA
jgi:uncharacterized damage-inducible protein DinB